jgi:hypothetical protein
LHPSAALTWAKPETRRLVNIATTILDLVLILMIISFRNVLDWDFFFAPFGVAHLFFIEIPL